jgi:hypothetical protein
MWRQSQQETTRMADRRPQDPDSGDETGRRIPRWLQLALIVVAVVVLVVVVMLLISGPGGHTPPAH